LLGCPSSSCSHILGEQSRENRREEKKSNKRKGERDREGSGNALKNGELSGEFWRGSGALSVLP